MPFIVQSGSKQYTVTNGQKFVVDRLQNEVDEIINLDLVFAYGENLGAKKITAKVVEHKKGKKLRIVKYKAKSNYHRQYGYRHYETVLELVS